MNRSGLDTATGTGARLAGLAGKARRPGNSLGRSRVLMGFQNTRFSLRSLPAPYGLVASPGCLSSSLPPFFASGRFATFFFPGA
jgi:hypothetical protein